LDLGKIPQIIADPALPLVGPSWRRPVKAALIREFGGPEVFEYSEVPTPSPRPDHVVVRVLACGVNRYDTFLRLGGITRDLQFPHVMGADIAGEILQLGSDVHLLSAGERVIIAPGFPSDPAEWQFKPENFAPSYAVTGTRSWGGYAQFVEVPAAFAIPDRTGLPPEQAACLPLVLVTALHAVATLGQVSPGGRVLVQAGASGSGSMCIQVARAFGGRVATTVGSSDKFAIASAAGAECVIDHHTEDFVAKVREWTDGRGADLVIDNIGGETLAKSLECLRPGGKLVNFGALGGVRSSINVLGLLFGQLTIQGSKMGSMEELHQGLELVAQRRVRPFLDRTFPLSDVAEAHRYMERRHVKGKIVLLPWEE
jgi:NADPH:quinone reductase-like Zn-dependent oxidoreductase